MRYIVCYDISDDRRRDRLAETLKDYGHRVQYSVFVADLDDDLAGRMRDAVARSAEPEDKVHVFVQCSACVAKTETFGAAEIHADAAYYIV